MKQSGLPTYGLCSAMDWALKRMAGANTDNTITRSAEKPGHKIAAPGIAKSAGSVKTGRCGIVKDVTSVNMEEASLVGAVGVLVNRTMKNQGRGCFEISVSANVKGRKDPDIRKSAHVSHLSRSISMGLWCASLCAERPQCTLDQ